jgi:glutathione S-transferase
MAATDLTLYELVLANGRLASPYAWRVRYALAHKGLAFQSVPVKFTDIPSICGGSFKTVPVLTHGDATVGDSWDIVLYLDRTFPGHPAIFSSPAEAAAVRLTDEWFSRVVQRKLFGIYALDVHDAACADDRPYFRKSREPRFQGVSLEAATADRVSRLPALREALEPLRVQLARHPYLGGNTPTYADYVVLGAFQWVASVSTLPLLAHDDPLRAWLDRGFDLYGGVGRDSRMKPLFE